MAADGQQSEQHPATAEGSGAEHAALPSHLPHRAVSLKPRFFEELKRRNLFRVAILYLIACWVILEPTHVVFHMLEVPEWANRLVILLMVIGFPLVLLFSWIYEITPEVLKPTVDVNPAQSIAHKTGQKLNHAIIVVLSLALVYFVADKFWLSKHLSGSEQLQPSSKEGAGQVTAALSQGASHAVPVSEKSIAVLPFVDMSEKKDQEYFSDGLSEELIDRLAHGPDLKVIARTSSFQFKGKNEDVRSIAGKLGVAHVLEGSVRKAGQELRITAQLIRASDGTHLWSQTYERKLADVFKVQDEIAGTVAQALRVALTSSVQLQNKEVRTDAYNLVLQGNYFKLRSTRQDLSKAIELYQAAIRLDPKYALAWARLGSAYMNRAFLNGVISPNDAARIRSTLEQAIRLDPNLIWAYYTRAGFVMSYEWNWAAAQADVERMRQIDPGDDFLLPSALADTASVFGQLGSAIELRQRLLERDPLDPIALDQMGAALCAADRLQECLEYRRQLLQLHPDYGYVHSSLSQALLLAGQTEGALGEIQKEPEEDGRLPVLAMVYSAIGRRAESDAALDQLQKKYSTNQPYSIAEVFAFRRETDSALKWLDGAYHQHDPGIVIVKTDPLLRNLRGDPRYQALLVKMKLDGDGPRPLR